MATVQQRGNSYFICVSGGRDVNGKQIRHTMTWTPGQGMTKKQAAKELERQKVLFQEGIRGGNRNRAVKFEAYARQWFREIASLKLKQRTLANYHSLETRIYKAIGHLRMDKITSRDIQKFVLELSEGQRGDRYKTGKLAPKTVRNYVALISTIYEHAIRMQDVAHNPCRAVTLPKTEGGERRIYSIEETRRILELLHREDAEYLHYVVYFTLAIFTGFRRGELLGLEWKDFDFDRQTVTVSRTSNYTNERGIFTDTPKTRGSYRTLKLPAEIMSFVADYKSRQAAYIETLGDKWVKSIEGIGGVMVEPDRLFTKWNGEPMFPNSPSLFFKRFCKKHGIDFLCGHSLRHLHASIEINAGVDVKTLQMIMGHSAATTTLQIYCHAFQAAQAAAMDRFSTVISMPTAAASSE